MFFLLSKLAWMLTAPVTMLLLLALVGTGLTLFGSGTAALAGARIAFGCVLLLLACGALPVGAALMRPLENRFPQAPADAPAPTGIIVLGGSTDEVVSAARNRVTIAAAAERITEAVVLARRYPDARLVFSGGSASITGIERTEAEDTRGLWIAMGIAPERITIEDRSRNTDENARFTREILHPEAAQTWLLVTSAFHMPRAMGLFRANGFAVTAYPVDFRTLGTARDWRPSPAVLDGLDRLTLALHEWVGLAAYRASRKTAALFPGP